MYRPFGVYIRLDYYKVGKNFLSYKLCKLLNAIISFKYFSYKINNLDESVLLIITN